MAFLWLKAVQLFLLLIYALKYAIKCYSTFIKFIYEKFLVLKFWKSKSSKQKVTKSCSTDKMGFLKFDIRSCKKEKRLLNLVSWFLEILNIKFRCGQQNKLSID